ncbi:MAG TPA: hypothetical protein DGT23_01340 [Micromonosporaceae bacterium]|nr:hypothetical protein [Micromonosporaceae bacterium]
MLAKFLAAPMSAELLPAVLSSPADFRLTDPRSFGLASATHLDGRESPARRGTGAGSGVFQHRFVIAAGSFC